MKIIHALLLVSYLVYAAQTAPASFDEEELPSAVDNFEDFSSNPLTPEETDLNEEDNNNDVDEENNNESEEDADDEDEDEDEVESSDERELEDPIHRRVNYKRRGFGIFRRCRRCRRVCTRRIGRKCVKRGRRVCKTKSQRKTCRNCARACQKKFRQCRRTHKDCLRGLFACVRHC